jgi:hypothetical protein
MIIDLRWTALPTVGDELANLMIAPSKAIRAGDDPRARDGPCKPTE